MSLKSRVVFFITGIFLILYGTVVYFSLEYFTETGDETSALLVREESRRVSERLVSYFYTDEKIIESGVERGAYQRWMKDPNNPQKTEEAIYEKELACELLQCYGWFIFSHETKDGLTFNPSLDGPIEEDLQEFDAEWYAPLIESGVTVFIDSNFDHVTKVRGVFF